MRYLLFMFFLTGCSSSLTLPDVRFCLRLPTEGGTCITSLSKVETEETEKKFQERAKTGDMFYISIEDAEELVKAYARYCNRGHCDIEIQTFLDKMLEKF